jgi:hypothetical protein
MCPSEATYLPADCCFSELALLKSNSARWTRTKRNSSSSHSNFLSYLLYSYNSVLGRSFDGSILNASIFINHSGLKSTKLMKLINKFRSLTTLICYKRLITWYSSSQLPYKRDVIIDVSPHNKIEQDTINI